MNKEQILGIVRHVLTAVGGAVGAEAYLSSDEITGAVAAVVTLVGVVWSVFSKKKEV